MHYSWRGLPARRPAAISAFWQPRPAWPLPHPIRTGGRSQQNTAGGMPGHFLDGFIKHTAVFPCSVSQVSPSGGSQLPRHEDAQAACRVASPLKDWGLQPAAMGGSHLGSRSSSPSSLQMTAALTDASWESQNYPPKLLLDSSVPDATGDNKGLWFSLPEKCKSKPQWGTITRQSEWLSSKSLQAINAGEGVEKREPSYTVGGNAN